MNTVYKRYPVNRKEYLNPFTMRHIPVIQRAPMLLIIANS